jgi:GT2 family glycosyltransferase
MMNASAIIPTANRPGVLKRTLDSIAEQSSPPAEIIVIDASSDDATRMICEQSPSVVYLQATERGAAQQRVQGIARATAGNILFLDDDIILEPECLARLEAALESSPQIGGVGATITNQQYSPPGKLTRLVLRLIDGPAEHFAGRKIAGILPQLPWDNDELPEIVPVEWINLGCTLYRREAFPDEPFPQKFFGASTAEDLALSLKVARSWQLVNARTARIYHDSQGGSHKRSQSTLAKMELVNRHHIMTQILGLRSPRSYFNLLLAQTFTLAGSVRQPGGLRALPARFWGKLLGLGHIATTRS